MLVALDVVWGVWWMYALILGWGELGRCVWRSADKCYADWMADLCKWMGCGSWELSKFLLLSETMYVTLCDPCSRWLAGWTGGWIWPTVSQILVPEASICLINLAVRIATSLG